jgi:hypothetical protein
LLPCYLANNCPGFVEILFSTVGFWTGKFGTTFQKNLAVTLTIMTIALNKTILRAGSSYGLHSHKTRKIAVVAVGILRASTARAGN